MTEERLQELIEKYANQTASASDERELLDWYRSGQPAKLEWNGETREQAKARLFSGITQTIRPAKRRTMPMQVLRVAASVLLVAGAISVACLFFKNKETKYVAVSTPPGKTRMVRLPDSSTVWLNAATTLSYAVSFADNREVVINGEAYFEVTKDLRHPFRVHAGRLTTTVLGTTFNVKAYPGDQEATISLVTGRINVSAGNKTLALLNPSQELRFDPLTGKSHTREFDGSSVLAWKKGVLEFRGVSLGEITATLKRWYDTDFILSDPKMRNCRLYLHFNSNISLDNLLRMMAEVNDMSYSIDKKNSTVTLTGKACSR